MNQSNNNLPGAVQDCHQLLAWIIPQLDKMPRLRRYTLGERLETILLQVLENLIEASYTKSSANVLKRANLKLDTARHLWRLARTLEAVSVKSYSEGAEQMVAGAKLPVRLIVGSSPCTSQASSGYWPAISSFEGLYQAYLIARKGKRKRREVQHFELDLEENLFQLSEAPSDGSAWETGSCDRRVLRGGGWSGDPGDLRSAYRNGLNRGSGLYFVGFRLARTL